MRYAKVINRTKGTIETILQDATVLATNAALTVAGMVASITSGRSASIESQTFVTDQLSIQLNFSSVGQTVLKVVTTFTGTTESDVKTYLLRTLDDGTGTVLDYV